MSPATSSSSCCDFRRSDGLIRRCRRRRHRHRRRCCLLHPAPSSSVGAYSPFLILWIMMSGISHDRRSGIMAAYGLVHEGQEGAAVNIMNSQSRRGTHGMTSHDAGMEIQQTTRIDVSELESVTITKVIPSKKARRRRIQRWGGNNNNNNDPSQGDDDDDDDDEYDSNTQGAPPGGGGNSNAGYGDYGAYMTGTGGNNNNNNAAGYGTGAGGGMSSNMQTTTSYGTYGGGGSSMGNSVGGGGGYDQPQGGTYGGSTSSYGASSSYGGTSSYGGSSSTSSYGESGSSYGTDSYGSSTSYGSTSYGSSSFGDDSSSYGNNDGGYSSLWGTGAATSSSNKPSFSFHSKFSKVGNISNVKLSLLPAILLLVLVSLTGMLLTAHRMEHDPEGTYANCCRVSLHTVNCIYKVLYNLYHCRLGDIPQVVFASELEEEEYTDEEMERMRLRPGIERALDVEHRKALRKVGIEMNKIKVTTTAATSNNNGNGKSVSGAGGGSVQSAGNMRR